MMDLLTAAFAVIGFLCIIAFFVFFSFGFSKKGVVVLAGTAFLLALFGILAGNVVPLWESGLIVFLLVLCVAYLFEKKLAFLFAGQDNDADEFPVWDEQEEMAVARGNRPAALDWPAANDAVLPAEKSAPAPETKEILPGKNGPGPETESTLPEEKDEPEWEELEDAAGNETGTALPENEQAPERSGEEEIAFLENRLEMLEETNEEHAVDQLPEMYGVEEWVAEAESPDTNPLDVAAAKEADDQDSEAVVGTGTGTPSGSENAPYVEQEEIPLLSFEKEAEAPAEPSGTGIPAVDELEEIDMIPFRETNHGGQAEKLHAENGTVGGAKGEDTDEPEEIDLAPVQEMDPTEQSEKSDLDVDGEAAGKSRRESTDELEEIDMIPFRETNHGGQAEKLHAENGTVGGAKGEDTDEPEEISLAPVQEMDPTEQAEKLRLNGEDETAGGLKDEGTDESEEIHVMPAGETGRTAEPEKLYSETGEGRNLQDESGAGTGGAVAANEAEPAGNPAVEEASETAASVPNGTTPIQKQLLGVLLEQLNLYRLTQPADAYEQLVKAHLHPQLAPEDYFTFASLLIDHYIAEQQFGKLHSLLRGLAETYAEYPVIREEIDFLRTKYGL
jgi:Ca2+/Na+ antiporter